MSEEDLPFQKLAPVYDELMGSIFYDKMLPYFELLIKKYRIEGKKMLELACGTGTCSIYFAKHGYNVKGLDVSTSMLEIARKKASREGVNIEFVKADMRNFNFDETFDLVVCLFDSINYILKKEELENCFNNTYNVLKEGGYFLFDINTIHGLREVWNNKVEICKINDGSSVWKTRWEEKSKIAYLTISVKCKNNSFKELHLERGYTKDELVLGLRNQGFTTINVLDCFSFRKGIDKSVRWMVIARK
ncbi:MAG TPA: class I SAM-dependent methyltransferase [bacterium (Candidatus Stahlbacteria)]|nr:class I SAM-dependent methyltransferase [Candidatus Stahlbacteria bacterium]